MAEPDEILEAPDYEYSSQIQAEVLLKKDINHFESKQIIKLNIWGLIIE